MCLAIPGRIVEIKDDSVFPRMGVVDFGGTRREVSLAYVPKAALGSYVIVHVGFAISIVNEKEAGRVFQDLEKVETLL
jgi:hydrogenase expression/formation protein HypC